MTPFVVAQIGAREHYAVARALHAGGQLAQLYTDAWSPPLRTALLRGPAPARALAARFHPDIPRGKVTAFTPTTLLRELTGAKPQTVEDVFLAHAAIGRAFCQRVNRTLPRYLRPGATYFGYNTGCLETLPLVRELGATSIVDQIDPAKVEQNIVLEECARFPDWQATPGKIPEAYYERLSQEWTLADRVAVNSRWSKQALIKQGVAKEKITVIPLAYEPSANLPPRPARQIGAPLRVLFLGQVILRKGIQYLFEAARLLKNENIQFTVAGPLGISEKAMATMPGNMRYVGRITREQLTATYLAHDVFVLPTLSDGFALTQLEAMAHGLPVIATPCCGEVVQDGQNGRIVPPHDAHALAAALAAHVQNPQLTQAQGYAATASLNRFSLAQLAQDMTRLPDSTPSFLRS